MSTGYAAGFGRISKKAYSRLRHSLGLPGGYADGAAVAVRKAMERHGIAESADGLVDADALHRLWETERGARSDSIPPPAAGEPAGEPGEPTRGEPGEPTRAGSVVESREPQVHGGALKRRKATPDPSEVAARESLVQAKTRKETALANIREKEDQEKDRSLVDRRAAVSAWFAAARKVRDRGMAEEGPLSDRLADAATEALAHNPSVELRSVFRPIVEAALREVFGSLARHLPEMVAAPEIEEREAAT